MLPHFYPSKSWLWCQDWKKMFQFFCQLDGDDYLLLYSQLLSFSAIVRNNLSFDVYLFWRFDQRIILKDGICCKYMLHKKLYNPFVHLMWPRFIQLGHTSCDDSKTECQYTYPTIAAVTKWLPNYVPAVQASDNYCRPVFVSIAVILETLKHYNTSTYWACEGCRRFHQLSQNEAFTLFSGCELANTLDGTWMLWGALASPYSPLFAFPQAGRPYR